MDPFHEFRATPSHIVQPDAFAEFRAQTPTGSSMPSGDAFPEFRGTPSNGMDSFPEFRPSRSSVSSDSFEEFRASMSLTGADGFSEFRAPPATTTRKPSGSRKPRQLMRRFLRLAPVLERAQPLSTPLIEDMTESEELHVTVPVPVEHAADVHVHLHSSNLVVEADDAIHTVRKITLPSAVLPSASAAFKDGKLAVTLHKCASPVDDEIHSIVVH